MEVLIWCYVICLMDDTSVVDAYMQGKSMRCIAKEFGTNHKLISRILKRNNIETRQYKHARGKRKFDCDKLRAYNNMLHHLRFSVSIEWLVGFDDIEKFKTLNRCITNRDNRFCESTDWYVCYIEKFYSDKQFNLIYNKWVGSGKQLYLKPSIDHIHPKSEGGGNELDNLQFLTWFENRCKNNMSQDVWDSIKQNIQEYFV